MKDAQARYYVFYKPYLTTSYFGQSGSGKKSLSDHLALPKDVYPVGRLDHDSEGLLILTNDIALHHTLMHPRYKVKKTYFAQLDGDIDMSALDQLKRGVNIAIDKETYRTKPANVLKLLDTPLLPERMPPIRFRKSVPTSWISIRITEGKNRQIRKMCAAVGFPVLRLHRTSIGDLELGDLSPGEIKMMEKVEMYDLLHIANANLPKLRHTGRKL